MNDRIKWKRAAIQDLADVWLNASDRDLVTATNAHLEQLLARTPDCPDHGKRDHGNLTVPMRYSASHRRLLRCSTCKARFSERKGTPLFDARLPADKVVSVLAHLAEGVGTRKTARHRHPLYPPGRFRIASTGTALTTSATASV